MSLVLAMGIGFIMVTPLPRSIYKPLNGFVASSPISIQVKLNIAYIVLNIRTTEVPARPRSNKLSLRDVASPRL